MELLPSEANFFLYIKDRKAIARSFRRLPILPEVPRRYGIPCGSPLIPLFSLAYSLVLRSMPFQSFPSTHPFTQRCSSSRTRRNASLIQLRQFQLVSSWCTGTSRRMASSRVVSTIFAIVIRTMMFCGEGIYRASSAA